MNNVENSTLSPEVRSLKNDIHTLETRLQTFRTRQDSWNEWYLRLGLTTIIIATLLGGASLFCQRKASNIELSSRPFAEELGRKNTRLREVIDQAAQIEVSKAQTDAFDASTRAGRADEAAAKAQASLAGAEQHSAEANAKAEGFRLDIAKANEGAAKAQAQVAEAQRAAAEANRIAESERLARLQLEARLADRLITPDQQRRLAQAFAPLKGETIDIVIFGDTPEINNTANTIANSIAAAGVLLNFFHPLGSSSARGVIIGTRKDASNADKEACKSLVLILRETLGGGVGDGNFDSLDASKAAGAGGGSPGAEPLWKAPIRLQVASK